MNNNSPTNSTLALCVVGALSSLASNQANAFQLGQLQEASRIGAPLDAYINVLMSPAEALQTTQVAVVPDFAYRNDAAMMSLTKLKNTMSEERNTVVPKIIV